jgi:hypothetical protein
MATRTQITDFFAAGAPQAKRARQENRDTSSSLSTSTPDPDPDASSAPSTSAETGTSGETSTDTFAAVFTRKGKHRFGYDPKWNEEFNWLEHRVDDATGRSGLYCTLCRKYNLHTRNNCGKWSSQPCLQLRRDKVVSHSKTDSHLAAVEKERLAVSAAIDGGIQQAMEKTFAVQRRALTGSLHMLYWLAKNEIGHFTHFESLRKLCLDLGCEYFSELSVARNVNYTSHRIISEWLEVINNVIEKDVLDKVHQCHCIGLMCDESTDISITKELILYCRIVCNREIQTHFLKLVQLPDGKAETIHDAIVAFLQGAGIHLSSVTSFGSDGASVMVGSSSGVATRLKQLNPQMLSIHCIHHRLALATAQAASSIPYLLRFQEILTSIYKFYHYSANRQAGLAEIQAVFHDPVLKVKEPKAVRWLSHAMAINAVKRSLPALLTSLERVF